MDGVTVLVDGDFFALFAAFPLADEAYENLVSSSLAVWALFKLLKKLVKLRRWPIKLNLSFNEII